MQFAHNGSDKGSTPLGLKIKINIGKLFIIFYI